MSEFLTISDRHRHGVTENVSTSSSSTTNHIGSGQQAGGSLVLTAEQLEELTDLRNKAAQIRWLSNNGIHYFVGASGRAKVFLSELERHSTSTSRRKREFKLAVVH